MRDTYYLIGTAAGPHPYPMIVRDFQSVIGREARRQIIKHEGPAARCAGRMRQRRLQRDRAVLPVHQGQRRCAWSGSKRPGSGSTAPSHAATINAGSVGVLHGNRTYLLQDEMGQIRETHSIAAGLDYPGVGPELAWLNDTGRAKYVAVTDAEALDALKLLSETEGIIPALESSHAVAHAVEARADDGAATSYDRQSVGPRRQGHANRRQGAGREPVDDCRMPSR